MSLTTTFNDAGQACIEDAKQTFGLATDQATIDFAFTLLKFAVAAKKQGMNMAIVQDMLVENRYSSTTEVTLDLKGMSQGKDGSGFKMPTFVAIDSRFKSPTF